MKKWGKVLIGVGIVLLIAFSIFYFSHERITEDVKYMPSNIENPKDLVSIEFIESLIGNEYEYDNKTQYDGTDEIIMRYSKSNPPVDCSQGWYQGEGCTSLTVWIGKKTAEEINKSKEGIQFNLNNNIMSTSKIDIGDFSVKYKQDASTNYAHTTYSVVFIKKDIWVYIGSVGPHSNHEIIEKVARDIESKI